MPEGRQRALIAGINHGEHRERHKTIKRSLRATRGREYFIVFRRAAGRGFYRTLNLSNTRARATYLQSRSLSTLVGWL
jgi:hypothetical protein